MGEREVVADLRCILLSSFSFCTFALSFSSAFSFSCCAKDWATKKERAAACTPSAVGAAKAGRARLLAPWRVVRNSSQFLPTSGGGLRPVPSRSVAAHAVAWRAIVAPAASRRLQHHQHKTCQQLEVPKVRQCVLP